MEGLKIRGREGRKKGKRRERIMGEGERRKNQGRNLAKRVIMKDGKA